MLKKGILVIGAGGHASSCIQLLEENKEFKILGLIGISNEVGKKIDGYEVLGSENNIHDFKKMTKNLILGVGQIKNSEIRMKLAQLYLRNGFNFPFVTSKAAKISRNSRFGEGTVIMHNAVVNTGVSIGSFSIINTGAILEHGTQVGDYTHIATGTLINGDSKIGNHTFVGSGSIIKNQISIGNFCIIGMGQVVRNNLSDNSIFIANQ